MQRSFFFPLSIESITLKSSLILQIFATILPLRAISHIVMQFSFKIRAIFEDEEPITLCFPLRKIANKKRPIWLKHSTQTVWLAYLNRTTYTLFS